MTNRLRANQSSGLRAAMGTKRRTRGKEHMLYSRLDEFVQLDHARD